MNIRFALYLTAALTLAGCRLTPSTMDLAGYGCQERPVVELRVAGGPFAHVGEYEMEFSFYTKCDDRIASGTARVARTKNTLRDIWNVGVGALVGMLAKTGGGAGR